MINIVDMANGMKQMKEHYGCKPIEIIKIEIKSSYTAWVTLENGDMWLIGYAGQASLQHKIETTASAHSDK